jgi:CMP-N,N'-diacetyllegionaminic acid synthase
MKHDLVLILVRENSKRLKNKSFLKIGDSSLLEKTIKFSKKIFSKNQILVSTDSKKIFKISNELGLICPWLRPKHLSKDSSSSYSAALHSIKWYEKKIKKIENIILLQSTTPFRKYSDFLNAYALFKKERKTIVSYSNIKLKNKEEKKYFEKKTKDLKKKYIFRDQIPNGSYFIIKKKVLIKEKTFYPKNHLAYLIKNFKYGIDIDTKSDYILAKKKVVSGS